MRPITNYKLKSIKLLTTLIKINPVYTIGQHLTFAFDDYNSIGMLSDKAFYENLKDYADTLSGGTPIDEDIDALFKQKIDIDSVLEDNEDEY
jgi:hypothetical protein